MIEEHTSPFRVRHATASNSALPAAVGAETFYDTFAAESTPENMAADLAEAFSPERQARKLADPACRFLIVEADGLTVGDSYLGFGEAPAVIVGRRPAEGGVEVGTGVSSWG